MSSIKTLLETMRRLRDKDNGCPWDIEQTFESLSPCVVEEAYEVSDAITRNDYKNLKEELGDVLLQVIFHAEIANELKLFNFDEIVNSLNKKLIRRHPHVFNGASKPLSADEQSKVWDEIKAKEKNKKDANKTFGNIPKSLPPIFKAKKIQKKAAKKGFDWKDSIDVINKVEEELKELQAELKAREEVPAYVWSVLEAMPKDSHPMAMFNTGILCMQHESVFAKRYAEGIAKPDYWEPTLEDTLNIIAKLPAIAAYVYRLRFDKGARIDPDPQADWGKNFVHMLGLPDPNGELTELMRLYLTK